MVATLLKNYFLMRMTLDPVRRSNVLVAWLELNIRGRSELSKFMIVSVLESVRTSGKYSLNTSEIIISNKMFALLERHI